MGTDKSKTEQTLGVAVAVVVDVVVLVLLVNPTVFYFSPESNFLPHQDPMTSGLIQLKCLG